MIATADNVHNPSSLQVLHKRRDHTIGSNTLHLIASTQLTITATTELHMIIIFLTYHKHTTLIIHYSTVTTSISDLHNAATLQSVNHVRNVGIHLLLVGSLALQALTPRVHIARGCMSLTPLPPT